MSNNKSLNPLQLLAIIFGISALVALVGVVLPAMVSSTSTVLVGAGLFLTAIVVVFTLYYGYQFVKERVK